MQGGGRGCTCLGFFSTLSAVSLTSQNSDLESRVELQQAEGRPSSMDVKTAQAALELREIYELNPGAFSVKDMLNLCILSPGLFENVAEGLKI